MSRVSFYTRPYDRLEPYDGKLSRTVLRGGAGSNASLLPDIHDTDDIVVVAKNLIKNMKEDPRQKNTADPIWEEGSTSLLEALLAYVYFEQPPEMHNMNSVDRKSVV